MPTKKILIIDDDLVLCGILQMVLHRRGFQAETAHNGLAGMEAFQRFEPDLVVLDIMMPKLDGWETCRRIRAVDDTPIIMFTILGGQADIDRGLKLGANEYMVKPVATEDLITNIKNILGRTSGSEPPDVSTLPQAELRKLSWGAAIN